MKHIVGDFVTIRPDLANCRCPDAQWVDGEMLQYRGKRAKIIKMGYGVNVYFLCIDKGRAMWTGGMFI